MASVTASGSASIDHFNFNLQNDLFVVGTRSGFAVHQTDPYKETVKRAVPSGVIIVELLGRTNILAVVTCQRPNAVQFWDDTLQAFKFELDFGQEPVKAVRLRRDVIIVVLLHQVRLYRFSNEFNHLQTFETVENKRGLIAASSITARCIVAFPGRQHGFLQIVHVDTTVDAETSSSRKPANIVIISTHESELACVTMNDIGTQVATASITGTLVRIWNTQNGQQITELRRGMDKASIESMAFSPDGPSATKKFCVISDKATVHVYHLPSESDNHDSNRKSSLAALASLGVPYFASRWSIAHARIQVPPLFQPKTAALNNRHLVGWVNENLFVVLSSSGGLWKYVVGKSKRDGEEFQCNQEAYRQWLRLPDR